MAWSSSSDIRSARIRGWRARRGGPRRSAEKWSPSGGFMRSNDNVPLRRGSGGALLLSGHEVMERWVPALRDLTVAVKRAAALAFLDFATVAAAASGGMPLMSSVLIA